MGSNLPKKLQGIFEDIQSCAKTNFLVVIQQTRESYEVCFHTYIRGWLGRVGLAPEKPLLEHSTGLTYDLSKFFHSLDIVVIPIILGGIITRA